MAQGALQYSGANRIDDLPMSAFQVRTVLLIAMSVVFDGLDNQMLGLAAPALLKEWAINRTELGFVFALGFVGMAFGTLTSGYVGDRFGRRQALLAGVGLFAIATLLTGFAGTLWQVAVLKTLAGVGLGGVPGTASAMIAEFTPARWRSLAVTFGVVCVSIGGVIGGLAAALIVPGLGWRWLFLLGGMATFAFLAILWRALPESPTFLANHPARHQEYAALCQRMGLGITPPSTLSEPSTRPHSDSLPPFTALLGHDLRRDSLALSLAMFAGMFMIYLMFNWSPTMLAGAGLDLGSASLGLTCFNLGGTLGALASAFVMMRIGSRATLATMAGIGALVCFLLALLPLGPEQGKNAMLLGLAVLGLFASAAQSAMFAVGAHAFPDGLRARGLGLMGAAGRLGAIVSAIAGATLVTGNGLFFGALCALMLLNLAGFLTVRRHIPRLDHKDARA